MYQLYCQNNTSVSAKTKKMDICSQVLIISCVIVSTLSSISDLARHVYCYIINKGLYYHPFNNYMAFADLLFACSSILFYLIAISRLQVSFYGTSYAISWYFLFCFYGLSFCFFILSIYYAIIVYLTPRITVDTFYQHYAAIPFIIIGSIDLILNTSLLYIFILKLKQLLSIRLLNCDIRNLKDYENCYTVKAYSRLLILMTRHTLLFSLAILTNQIWYIAVLIRIYVLPSHSDMHLSNLCVYNRTLSNLSNCIVLFLSLGSNHKIYSNLCGCCHQKIQNCFVENISLNLNYDNNDQLETKLTSDFNHSTEDFHSIISGNDMRWPTFHP